MILVEEDGDGGGGSTTRGNTGSLLGIVAGVVVTAFGSFPVVILLGDGVFGEGVLLGGAVSVGATPIIPTPSFVPGSVGSNVSGVFSMGSGTCCGLPAVARDGCDT